MKSYLLWQNTHTREERREMDIAFTKIIAENNLFSLTMTIKERSDFEFTLDAICARRESFQFGWLAWISLLGVWFEKIKTLISLIIKRLRRLRNLYHSSMNRKFMNKSIHLFAEKGFCLIWCDVIVLLRVWERSCKIIYVNFDKDGD